MFSLALRLGQPVYLLEEMPHAEFVEWVAFFDLKNNPPPPSVDQAANARATLKFFEDFERKPSR